jgi:hypothetical protein
MRQHELRPDMNEGPKLGIGNHPVNVDFWVIADDADSQSTLTAFNSLTAISSD